MSLPALDKKKAADALVSKVIAFEKGLPTNDKTVRSAVAKSLSRKRLHQSKFDEVLQTALASRRIEEREGRLYPVTFKQLEPSAKNALPENKERALTVEKARSPHPSTPRPKNYMGMMLEGRLNDKSRELPDGRKATATFCHCPACGVRLLLEGSVVVAPES